MIISLYGQLGLWAPSLGVRDDMWRVGRLQGRDWSAEEEERMWGGSSSKSLTQFIAALDTSRSAGSQSTSQRRTDQSDRFGQRSDQSDRSRGAARITQQVDHLSGEGSKGQPCREKSTRQRHEGPSRHDEGPTRFHEGPTRHHEGPKRQLHEDSNEGRNHSPSVVPRDQSHARRMSSQVYDF
jgi:hypothetical protein